MPSHFTHHWPDKNILLYSYSCNNLRVHNCTLHVHSIIQCMHSAHVESKKNQTMFHNHFHHFQHSYSFQCYCPVTNCFISICRMWYLHYPSSLNIQNKTWCVQVKCGEYSYIRARYQRGRSGVYSVWLHNNTSDVYTTPIQSPSKPHPTYQMWLSFPFPQPESCRQRHMDCETATPSKKNKA